ncbi:hypothetical protein niasHT_023697 [Heterodera trifolii]|uniref:FLYWCH-type domain-containing protein n=1 Tax=Heterodera trifolii TaxID=157864 RepID=A0ABD2JA09_9BILA
MLGTPERASSVPSSCVPPVPSWASSVPFNADGDVKFWRCEQQHGEFKCRGRIHTTLNDVVLMKIITGIKRRAAETMETPAAIRAHTLQQIPTPVMTSIPTKNATKKLVKRVRHEIELPPPVPLTLQELELPEQYRIYKRTEEVQELFILVDSGTYTEQNREGQHRILIFGRLSFGNWASEMNRDKWVFPVLHCLLTCKSQSTYERMFDMVRNRWPTFSPTNASMNYVGRLRNNGTRARPLFLPARMERVRAHNEQHRPHKQLRISVPSHVATCDRNRTSTSHNMEIHKHFANAPPPKSKRYRDTDTRILRILHRYNDEKTQPQIDDDHQYGQNQNNPNLTIEMLRGISSNYQMDN